MPILSMPAIERHSTRQLPLAERLPYWNHLASEVYCPLVIDSEARADFNGDMTRLQLGPFEFTRASSSPATVRYQGSTPRPVEAFGLQTLARGTTLNTVARDSFEPET